MEIKVKVQTEGREELEKVGVWFLDKLMEFKYGKKDGYTYSEWKDVNDFAKMLSTYITDIKEAD